MSGPLQPQGLAQAGERPRRYRTARTDRAASGRATLIIYGCVATALGAIIAYIRLSGLSEYSWIMMVLASVVGIGGLFFLIATPSGFLSLVLAFLPFTRGLFQFEIGIVTFSPFSMGMIVIWGFALMRMLGGRKRYRFEGMDGILFLLCLFYFVNSMLAEDWKTMVGGGFLAFHSLFLPVISYFTIRVLVETREAYDQCLIFLLAGIVGFSLVGITQYAATGHRVELLGVPAVSVATLAVVPLFLTLFTDRSRNGWGKLAFLAGLASLVLSFSRMYLVSFLLSPLFLKLVRRKWVLPLFLFMTFSTLAGTTALSLSVPGDTVRNIVAQMREMGQDMDFKQKEHSAGRLVDPGHWKQSLELRAFTYRLGWDHFLESPVVGNGIRKGRFLVTQHNYHLEWLEFGGVIGYVLYTLVFVAYFRRFGRVAARNKDVAAMVMVVFTILCNSLTNGFMHGFFSYVVYIMIGFTYAAEAVAEAEPEELEQGAAAVAPGAEG